MDDPGPQGRALTATARWRKLGLVFGPDGTQPWMRSHASLPLPLRLDEHLYRVYFAARDERNRSSAGFVEFDIRQPDRRLALSDAPALAPGPLGHFDDHGVYPASLVQAGGELLLYYIGWNPGPRQPLFYSSIGLAVSTDGGRSFRRLSAAPVMARSDWDPCLVTSPCVLRENGAWRMWYVSGFKWEETDGQLQSYYHIKYAESADGLAWTRRGVVCIDLAPGERNIARPCVLRDADRYRMWYSRNAGEGYRIGYAESSDGVVWTRRDADVGVELSSTGWDSEAQAYPWVFDHDGTKYMLYNGNAFGRDGFGLAVEEC